MPDYELFRRCVDGLHLETQLRFRQGGKIRREFDDATMRALIESLEHIIVNTMVRARDLEDHAKS